MLQTRLGGPLRHAVWIGLFSAIFACRINGQTAAASTLPTSPSVNELHRWFDLDALSVSTRYRFVESRSGHATSDQQQWQFSARGRFKFDRAGRFSVVATLATGNSITGGWNNTGLGTGDLQSNLFVKQLYLNVRPTKSVEIEFGGIGINNGENTEITGYDNDVYVTEKGLGYAYQKSSILTRSRLPTDSSETLISQVFFTDSNISTNQIIISCSSANR